MDPDFGFPILSVNLLNHIGNTVRVSGWVQRVRRLGALTFVVVRDPAGLLQVAMDRTDERQDLTPESVVVIRGQVVKEPRAPGGVELRHPDIEVVSLVEDVVPINLYTPALAPHLNSLLDWRPLSLRHPSQRLIFRIQAALAQGFRESLREKDFVEVHTPKLIAAASEGGADVFPVKYFEKTAYLAQSPQLYKQMMVGVFGRVFEVGPVFRAEPHATSRHLSEYVSLDAEMGFIDNHRTVMGVLRHVLDVMLTVAAHHDGENSIEWPMVPDPIPSLHFSQALQLISKAWGEDLGKEPDLSPACERWLGEWAKARFGSDFLFVEGYPTSTRPFYTARDPEQPLYSNSFDLLFRGQEIVTGGQRLHRYPDYVAALAERGMSAQGLEGYLRAFQFGMPAHGGFAIGLERLTARLLGLSNIREASLFPRDRTRLTP